MPTMIRVVWSPLTERRKRNDMRGGKGGNPPSILRLLNPGTALARNISRKSEILGLPTAGESGFLHHFAHTPHARNRDWRRQTLGKEAQLASPPECSASPVPADALAARTAWCEPCPTAYARGKRRPTRPVPQDKGLASRDGSQDQKPPGPALRSAWSKAEGAISVPTTPSPQHDSTPPDDMSCYVPIGVGYPADLTNPELGPNFR